MTLDELITTANNGNIPSFEDIQTAFPQQGFSWYIRTAMFGDANAAIQATHALLGNDWTWHIGYDNRAILTRKDNPMDPITSISVNPGHALILGALMAHKRDMDAQGVIR
jgi:hypothetical protein